MIVQLDLVYPHFFPGPTNFSYRRHFRLPLFPLFCLTAITYRRFLPHNNRRNKPSDLSEKIIIFLKQSQCTKSLAQVTNDRDVQHTHGEQKSPLFFFKTIFSQAYSMVANLLLLLCLQYVDGYTYTYVRKKKNFFFLYFIIFLYFFIYMYSVRDRLSVRI